MKTTSHFIGIQLKASYLADLFVELYDYFNHKNGIIEFQNPNSFHITIYYLPSSIDYKKFVKLDSINTKITLNDIGYFGPKGKEIICYLTNNNLDFLEEEFNKYKELFPNDVSENDLDFVAHATLFRIKDSARYNIHKSEVDEIINKHLLKISSTDLYEDILLYKVNSNYRPELQLPVN